MKTHNRRRACQLSSRRRSKQQRPGCFHCPSQAAQSARIVVVPPEARAQPFPVWKICERGTCEGVAGSMSGVRIGVPAPGVTFTCRWHRSLPRLGWRPSRSGWRRNDDRDNALTFGSRTLAARLLRNGDNNPALPDCPAHALPPRLSRQCIWRQSIQPLETTMSTMGGPMCAHEVKERSSSSSVGLKLPAPVPTRCNRRQIDRATLSLACKVQVMMRRMHL